MSIDRTEFIGKGENNTHNYHSPSRGDKILAVLMVARELPFPDCNLYRNYPFLLDCSRWDLNPG